jgi:hypothetical protein
MCVLPQETPCSKGKTKSGNSNKYTLEEKDIETPNTAPDAAAAVILSFLNNSGNLYHQTLHTTTTSTNTDTPLQFSTRPPHVQNTNNQTILPYGIMYQVRFLNQFMVSKC